MDDRGDEVDEFDEFDEEGGEEDLMHIFEFYASYGEPLPAAELHASKVTWKCRERPVQQSFQ